jgi:acylphosphatase
MERIAKRLLITGRVQGVGFRFYMQRKARELGLTGWVRNCRDGLGAARPAQRRRCRAARHRRQRGLRRVRDAPH